MEAVFEAESPCFEAFGWFVWFCGNYPTAPDGGGRCQFAGKSSQEIAGENHPPLR